MCTVSFLPVNKTSFILTHNRDEHINRGVAFLPIFYEISSNKIVFPKDSKANGTWISTSKNYSLCLLNGGFEKHKHEPPYKHSRGQL
nr:NRDE family protein [Chitinophagaceae bacterium]